MLFGRSAELAAGREVLARAFEGNGGVVLLSGEPGIGKSALVRALADDAEAKGARVAWGRAWEVGGAPAYWPWSQALADLGLDLDELLGNGSGEAAAAQRLVAFDRVARRLFSLANEQPLVVVLDDLHAADIPTLELAVAVARGIARRRVVLLATSRESELRDAPLHGDLVAKLAREGRRIALERLGAPAIADWLNAVHFDGDATEVLRVTEGNPLFVEEAVRIGVARFAGAAAGGAAVILREHLARATPPTRELLSVAAVLGREASFDDVAAVAGASLDDVARAAQEGVRTGVLDGNGHARVAFAHVLLRDTLYESLPPTRRAELHARAAETLASSDANATLCASHLLSAASAVPTGKIVDAVERAARLALRQHAHAGAITLVDRARRTLGARIDDAAALALDLVVAEAKMGSGAADEGRQLAASCAERAKRLNRPEALGRAALVYGLEVMSGQRDALMVQLLEDALAVCPEHDTRLRCHLVARVSAAMVPVQLASEMERAQARAREGIAIARSLGDPETLLLALRFSAGALGYAVSLRERHVILDELMQLARMLGDELTLVNVSGFYVAHLFELGQPERARAEAESYQRLLERLPLPHAKWRGIANRASVAALDGDFAQARELATELRRMGLESGAKPALLSWALLQLSLSIADGDTSQLRASQDEVVALLSKKEPMGPWLACAYALLGKPDEARNCLAPVLARPDGFPWLTTAGQVASLLGDAELAAAFYPLLHQEALIGRFFWGPAGVFPLGPTSRILGELARLMGRPDLAREHLDEAIAQCRECGAKSLLDLCLRARARLDDGAPPASKRAPKRREITLAREGDVWLVGAAGAAPFRVKHTKGFDYLHALLTQPGRELYVLALAGAGEGAEDAGVILDGRAKAEYRQRVEELEDQLTEAESLGDLGRAEKARREMEAIATELASAVGLGNRDKKAASNVERARINVQRRIKDAVRRIAEQNAELGQYLEATVKTGAYCVYEPI